jgi:hypothetical protein
LKKTEWIVGESLQEAQALAALLDQQEHEVKVCLKQN